MGTATLTQPRITATLRPPVMSWHRTSKRWTLSAPAISGVHQSQFYTFIVLQGEYDGQIAVFKHDTLTVPVEPYATFTVATARALWQSCISCNWTLA